MNKNSKSIMSFFLALLMIFFSLTIKGPLAQACGTPLAASDVHLVLDTLDYNDMPKNFRKSSSQINAQSGNNLNLKGLSTLNISGSEQFSEFNLPLVSRNIGTTMPITVIDLRQESHGFINGLPVSWANEKNDANLGLSKEQILLDENSKLSSVKLNVPLSFYNHPDMTVVPTKVENESQLVASNSLSYVRIPVTDGKLPSPEMVDCFVELVKSKPENAWFHYHCKHGEGRTTTFMIMHDMIQNSKKASADDIIQRQLLLANFDQERIKSFYKDERIVFLKNFYEYCSKYGDGFKVKWSNWSSHP